MDFSKVLTVAIFSQLFLEKNPLQYQVHVYLQYFHSLQTTQATTYYFIDGQSSTSTTQVYNVQHQFSQNFYIEVEAEQGKSLQRKKEYVIEFCNCIAFTQVKKYKPSIDCILLSKYKWHIKKKKQMFTLSIIFQQSQILLRIICFSIKGY